MSLRQVELVGRQILSVQLRPPSDRVKVVGLSAFLLDTLARDLPQMAPAKVMTLVLATTPLQTSIIVLQSTWDPGTTTNIKII